MVDCRNSRFLDGWENSLIGSVLRGKKGKSGDNTIDNFFEELCEENSSLTECGIEREREFCLCVF